MVNKNDFLDNLTPFPHIIKKIDTCWGSADCRSYIHSLMRQDDRTDRQGFPLYAWRSIYDLAMLHDDEFPQFRPKPGPWDFVS